MQQPYYVYEHWRPDTGQPFYVGKGKGGRAYDMALRNPYHKRVAQKLARSGLRPHVQVVAMHPTETEALAHEAKRIQYWRARGVPLTNLTGGGERPRRQRVAQANKAAMAETVLYWQRSVTLIVQVRGVI